MISAVSPTAAWYAVGFLGQLIFGSRFFIQWIVSERARRVIIPKLFWYLSLLGGVALFAYALYRRDPVFAVGQGLGLIVYTRNIILHRAPQPASA
ncbi:MAG TPA: lipid-A-disaccharide synthase N-terminal domain-containing protein [Candidatus Dormibacteraeota bacterium]|nr:lipid-A-disaccharide synthase N-terminal domain-containing protein [Candidatus Dormibacteraeota bacterium]